MSTYLKLEMTLTYSSHFTSLDQERGAGAVNSQKKVFTLWLIPYLNMMLKLDAVIILWELFVELIRWISPLPFLISTKVRQRWPLCLMEIFREDSLFWKNSLPDCFCCILWFPALPPTLIYGKKREVLRGPALQHLDDRPDYLKQLSLFH